MVEEQPKLKVRRIIPYYGYSPDLPLPKHYMVSKGDNLFAIAIKYDLDFRKLANANNISKPYTIYPGQQLKLAEAESVKLPQKPKVTNPAPTKTVKKETPKVTQQNKAPPVKSQKPVEPATPVENSTNGRLYWQWPIKGSIVRTFKSGDVLNKGIDIKPGKGQSVVAAADGIVIYSGTGLKGYGHLIILKHNDQWLSAYAHLANIKVRENQRVKANERLADVDKTNGDAVLHFEIRHEGKPKNPLNYLPKQ